jgi:multimeric flavodoxin WrbA
MKILAIISSPRKKNTYNAVKAIEEVHKNFAECEYEYLFLNKFNLKLCVGCHLCLTKGEEFCPCKDDSNVIVEKIESADGVILASPNHTMNVNWRMKNYIDRFSYIMHRPRYFHQRFMILISSGSYQGIKPAMKSLSPIVCGGKIVSKISVMSSPGMNDKKRDKQLRKLKRKAKKFVKKMNKSYKYRPSFGELIWFSAFKSMQNEENEHNAADYKYYAEKEFFVETKLNFVQKITMKFFQAMFRFLIRIGMV